MVQNRVPRKNTGFFEEIKSNSFERECKEEVCTYEEMKECFPEEKQRAKETWDEFNDHCYRC